MRLIVLLLITCCLPREGFTFGEMDSTRNKTLEALADKMHLKTPTLKEGEYEVRIWKREQLQYGDAQMLYVLNKTNEKLSASKYIINFDGHRFQRAIKNKPAVPVTLDLWERLMQQDMLTLPDASSIYDKLHPKPQRDSTWNVVETDGSVSVKAKRKTNRNVIVGDGESYYFEVFSPDKYHNYNYSNPSIYLRFKPDIPELRKVVSILDELSALFYSPK